ncbi:MAG TPA: flagellar filament capping protein FliD [Rhodocyclaceae bacterium]
MSTTGTISAAGIGSGIDVNGIITKLMAVEQQPLNNLKTKEASFQAKLTAFGTLKGAFSSVQTAVDALNSPLLFKNVTATASDPSIMSASANTAATPGVYSMNVLGLAQAETIASSGFADMTSSMTATSGTMTIELGTFTSGGAASGFVANSPTPVTVTIGAGSSLGAIRDAINNANAGVTARIVDVGGSAGSQYKLMISSNQTGANQSMRILTYDSTGAPITNNTGLGQLAYDPAQTAGSGNEYTVTMQAQDAHIQINNLDIYRAANTFSDALTGVTMNLTKLGSTNLTVAKDTSGIQTAIQNFVTAYNTAAQQVRTLSAYNATTQQAAILTGDSGARGLQDALSQMLNISVFTESSSIKTLTDLGVTVQRDGTLQFNTGQLSSAIASDPTAVQQLIAGGYQGNKNGLAAGLESIMTSIMDDQNGILTTSTDGINNQITDVQSQETALQTRLTQVQANYQAQFSAMDSFVSSWNATSSYLTQQLAALNGTSSTTK